MRVATRQALSTISLVLRVSIHMTRPVILHFWIWRALVRRREYRATPRSPPLFSEVPMVALGRSVTTRSTNHLAKAILFTACGTTTAGEPGLLSVIAGTASQAISRAVATPTVRWSYSLAPQTIQFSTASPRVGLRPQTGRRPGQMADWPPAIFWSFSPTTNPCWMFSYGAWTERCGRVGRQAAPGETIVPSAE